MCELKMRYKSTKAFYHDLTYVSNDAREVVFVDGFDDCVVKKAVLGKISGAFVADFPSVDGLVLAPPSRPLPPLLLLLRDIGAAVLLLLPLLGLAVLHSRGRRLLRVVLGCGIVTSTEVGK